MKVFTALLLIIVALLIASFALPIGLVYACFYFTTASAWYTYFFRIAMCVDELGNVVCGPLFNTLFITKEGYPFGLQKETISSALGKNVEKGTLKTAGKLLNALLDKIQKNHATLSIDAGVTNS